MKQQQKRCILHYRNFINWLAVVTSAGTNTALEPSGDGSWDHLLESSTVRGIWFGSFFAWQSTSECVAAFNFLKNSIYLSPLNLSQCQWTCFRVQDNSPNFS